LSIDALPSRTNGATAPVILRSEPYTPAGVADGANHRCPPVIHI